MQCVIKTHYKYDKHHGYHPEVPFQVPALNLMRSPEVIHRHRRWIPLTATSEIPLLKAFIAQPFHLTPANHQGFSGCAENNGLSENSCRSIMTASLSCSVKPGFSSSSCDGAARRWWAMFTEGPVENIPPWPSSKHTESRDCSGKPGLAQE